MAVVDAVASPTQSRKRKSDTSNEIQIQSKTKAPKTPKTPVNQSSAEAPKQPKRAKSPGVRVVGSRIYDSENGKSCHQCRQKTLDFSVECTNIRNGKLCTIKFCHKCLVNRYGEKAEEVALLGDWKCPKCRDMCNCSNCMKKRGHQPTGILAHTAKATGFSSVSEMLRVQGPESVSKLASPRKSLPTDKDTVAVSPCKLGKENAFDGKSNMNLQTQPLLLSDDKKPKKSKEEGQAKTGKKAASKISEISQAPEEQVKTDLPNPPMHEKESKELDSKSNSCMLTKETKKEKGSLINEKKKKKDADVSTKENKKEKDADVSTKENKKEKDALTKENKKEKDALTNEKKKEKDSLTNEKKKERDAHVLTKENKKENGKDAPRNENKEKDAPTNEEKKEKDAHVLATESKKEKDAPTNEEKKKKDAHALTTEGKKQNDAGKESHLLEKAKNMMRCESDNIHVAITLPKGKLMTSISDIDLPPEDVGEALQFLEFCATFGEVLGIRKGQPEAVLRDIMCGRSRRSGKFSSVGQFHNLLLTFLLDLEEESSCLSPTGGNSSWLRALKQYISESDCQLKGKMVDKGYEMLNNSEKLRLLTFLCDETLDTTEMRSWIDDQNAKFAEKTKEEKAKLTAAKNKEKDLKQKLQDDIAKAIIAKNGDPLTIAEHDSIVSEIKADAARAHMEMVEARGSVHKRKHGSDSTRTEPIVLDPKGRAYWRLKGYTNCGIMLQDVGVGDLASKDNWFSLDAQEEEVINKYIQLSRVKRPKRQEVVALPKMETTDSGLKLEQPSDLS